jgi:3-dehydroquinate dehydratase-2
VTLDHNRIQVMHGVNLNMLERRDPAHYGTLTLRELELRVTEYADELGLKTRFFQSNAESEFIERLHGLEDIADGIILNPGAWTHYSWAIREALEIAALPAVEVHLSDVSKREQWRRVSVIGDLCLATVSGRGVEGYRDALAILRDALVAG